MTYGRLCILFVIMGLIHTNAMMGEYPVENPNEPNQPFPWPEGKRGAVSLTFDDARLSQIDHGIPLLNQYGVKATFYISPNSLLKRLDGWIAAARAGHEIGNHSMTHPCTGNYAFSRNNALEEYDLARIEQNIVEANRFIFEKLNIHPVSFAYPCGQTFVGRGEQTSSYIPVVAKLFLSGRGWLGEGANDPWFCDLSQLLGMESDGKSFAELKQLVDRAAIENRWLILAGHEIDTDGHQTTRLSSLRELCEYATDPARGIWIDTVSAVATHIHRVREGDAAK